MNETYKYIKRKEDRAIEVFSQALEEFNKTGNIIITQDEFKEYIPVLLNIIQKQRKEDKSEADEIFNKLGFNKYEFDISIDYVSRENRQGISFKKRYESY